MTLDQWLILAVGLAYLAIPITMLLMVISDWRSERKRALAADELTALWDGPDYSEADRD